MSTRTIWANNLTQEYLKGLPEESKRTELVDYGYDAQMIAPLSNEELNKLIDEDEYMWEIDAEDLENKIIPKINSQTKDGLIRFVSESSPENSYFDYAESMIDPSIGQNNAQFLTRLEDIDGKVVATFEDGSQYALYAINSDEDKEADVSTLNPINTDLNESKEELTEAKVKDHEGLEAELEEIKPLVDEYGFEYFTSMPLVNFDNDTTSVEYQYPNFFKIVKAFFKEMGIVADLNNIDELEDNWAMFSQRDWDTCMTVCNRCLETGKSYQMEKIYAATDNEAESESAADEMINLTDESVEKGYNNKFNLREDDMVNDFMDVMMDNNQYANEPEVGIFWYSPTEKKLFGVNSVQAHEVDFADCKLFDQKVKTCGKLHKDAWKKGYYKKDPLFNSEDHTQVPRGRVFELEDGSFIVMVGNWIKEYPEAKEAIIYEFNLPEDKTKFKTDEHWDIGHGFSKDDFLECTETNSIEPLTEATKSTETVDCFIEIEIDPTKISIKDAIEDIKSKLNIVDANIDHDDSVIDFEWTDERHTIGETDPPAYDETGRIEDDDREILKSLGYVKDFDITYMYYNEDGDIVEDMNKLSLDESILDEGVAKTRLDDIRDMYIDDELILDELMAYLSSDERDSILSSICADYDIEINYDNSFDTWQELQTSLGNTKFLDDIVIKMSSDELNEFADHLIELYDLEDEFDDLDETLIRKVRDKRKAIEDQMNESLESPSEEIEEEPKKEKTPEEQLQEDLDNLLKEKNEGIIKCYRKNAGIRTGEQIPVDEDLDTYASDKTCMTYNINKDTLRNVLFKENA